MKLPKLEYFEREEFVRGEDWFTKMSPRLLVLLDTFRHLTGKCIISPHPKALGRRDDTDSQHNIERWGEVRAVDVFPSLKTTTHFTNKPITFTVTEWKGIAEQLGFTGIGIYPNWTYEGEQRPGLHLDCRESAKPGEPVTWGRIGNDYVSLDKAMEVLA